jgi:YbbR domain-containing protein
LTVDLTGYSEGTHKVNIKYNNPINTLDYKLDPSRITIVIYPKVSETRTLSIDVLNQDKLNEKLTISSVELSKTEVIVKSYKEKLATVASVKAIVDANALNATEAGTYTLDNVRLVAYDENGTEINGIEIVPGNVTATVEISSPSKVVPINIVPDGDVASGSAISSITPNVSSVTLYGDAAALKDIDSIDVVINVNDLSQDKTFQETIVKPSGVRSMSETAVTIKVVMERETSVVFDNIPIQLEGLDTTKYKALAANEESTKVSVVVKGVKTLLNKLTADNITATVDLSDLGVGTWEVNVKVTGKDNKLTYTSRTTKVKIIITEK